MMPRITRPQVYRVVREMLLRERFGPADLLRAPGYARVQRAGQALPCQAPRRLRSRRLRPPSLNRRCNTSNAVEMVCLRRRIYASTLNAGIIRQEVV